MLHPRNRSRRYLEGMPLYDLHVTTKSFDVAGLRELGARGVFYIAKGYDPHTHRPMALSPEEQVQWGAQVGFVGGYEEQRYRAIRSIAEAGVDVTVRGPNWQSVVRRVQRNLEVRPGWVYLDNYTRSICATWINLCFLRKSVGDLHTARSIEIPACRAFMLAERTDEHRALFVEGKEAEFFDGEQELIDKIRYYLHHEEERQRIAANGYERCIHSGYSYAERLRPVLDYVETPHRMSALKPMEE
jgi:spore maturation protein CgeB